jgi:hypothetical protein
MQQDFMPRNRAERIRKRAWRRIQEGDLPGYTRLVGLSQEVGAIRFAD